MAVNIPTPPGGRTAPGGEIPPGGEGVPGGRGAPGGTTTPTAPLGRPPRITLRPLRKRGQQKMVQKVKITPDRGAQVRSAVAKALTPKQRQEQIHAHVKETMPQFKPAETGKEVPPQAAGMGQKGQAHKAETRAQHKAAKQITHTKVNTRLEELREEGLAYAKAARETHQKSLSDTEKSLAASRNVEDDPEAGKRPSYGIRPPQIKGETVGQYEDRFVAAQEAYNAAHQKPEATP